MIPTHARIAIAPIAGNRSLAHSIEDAMFAQRPQSRVDIAVFTPEQLLENSAVRLASTAPLTSDILSLGAARNAGAEFLLQGEILNATVDLASTEQPAKPEKVNWNQAYFRKPKDSAKKQESILLSWRVIDVKTSKTIETASFNLSTQAAIKLYPDLDFVEHDQSQLLISAAARETWKTVCPYVAKEKVELASPWLLPGSFFVRRGVSAARKGQWELAEQRWQTAAKLFPFNSAAQHNLAIAYAAREDFPAAKQQLQKAAGLFSYRLPSQTLFWLDQQHRNYNRAHQLGKPGEGWAFPDPSPNQIVESVPVADIATLPWWTALPLAKPPGWTWQGWLSQPWVF